MLLLTLNINITFHSFNIRNVKGISIITISVRKIVWGGHKPPKRNNRSVTTAGRRGRPIGDFGVVM